MKKKYLVTTVAMLAAVSMLAACGNKNKNEDTTPTPTVTVAPTDAPSSDERGDGPSTPAPTEAPEPTVAPTEAPAKPTEAPTENNADDTGASAKNSSTLPWVAGGAVVIGAIAGALAYIFKKKKK